jgi:hypothetical protein
MPFMTISYNDVEAGCAQDSYRGLESPDMLSFLSAAGSLDGAAFIPLPDFPPANPGTLLSS